MLYSLAIGRHRSAGILVHGKTFSRPPTREVIDNILMDIDHIDVSARFDPEVGVFIFSFLKQFERSVHGDNCQIIPQSCQKTINEASRLHLSARALSGERISQCQAYSEAPNYSCFCIVGFRLVDTIAETSERSISCKKRRRIVTKCMPAEKLNTGARS